MLGGANAVDMGKLAEGLPGIGSHSICRAQIAAQKAKPAARASEKPQGIDKTGERKR